MKQASETDFKMKGRSGRVSAFLFFARRVLRFCVLGFTQFTLRLIQFVKEFKRLEDISYTRAPGLVITILFYTLFPYSRPDRNAPPIIL